MTARHLVILVHADPSVRSKYETALAHVDVELAIVNSPYGAFSSAYSRLAEELRARPGSILDALAERAGVGSVARYRHVTLVTFSAGYALARALLTEPASFDGLDGYVALDSIHSGTDADGSPADAQLVGFVRQALAAADGPRVCWIGHTDVDPIRYASTTDTANEIRRLTIERRCAAREEIELMGLVFSGAVDYYLETGGFRIRAFDESTSDRVEHGLALTGWGPAFVAGAVETLQSRAPRRARDTDPAATITPIGERALELALAEQASGVREIPGTRDNARILEYLAGCERKGVTIGRWLQSDSYAWCAAAACYCAFMVAGEAEVPHKWRASVLELWGDLIVSGYAVSAPKIREGIYRPAAGDLLILTRGGNAAGYSRHAFARTAGKGHVGRIIKSDEHTVTTLDGNVGDTWTTVERRWSDPSVVGVGAYPRRGLTPLRPGLDELNVLADLPRVA